MQLEQAVVLRYLTALNLLAPHYAFARVIQRDLTEPSVNIYEYIAPVHRTPMHALSPDEALWKRTAERIHAPS